MARYRCLAADLLSGTILEEIPFSTFGYSHVLNRPGAFSATIGLRHAKAARAILSPAKTAIHIEREGAIAWSGILWTAQASSGGSSLTVAGAGWWSYFRRRFIRTTKTYVATDQLVIARDLLAYAQGIAGGDIGLILGAETCGVLRDRTYNGFERKNVAEAIEQLAAVRNGFDFAVETVWSGARVAKTLRLSYPRRGSVTPLVFELGVNLAELDQEVDGTKQANVVDVAGAGEGDSLLFATAAAADRAGYPLLEAVHSRKDVTVLSTLQAYADLELAGTRLPPSWTPSIRVLPTNPDTAVGNYTIGDTVTVRGSDGWLQIPAEAMRIMELNVSVAESGDESVTVGLAPEAATL